MLLFVRLWDDEWELQRPEISGPGWSTAALHFPWISPFSFSKQYTVYKARETSLRILLGSRMMINCCMISSLTNFSDTVIHKALQITSVCLLQQHVCKSLPSWLHSYLQNLEEKYLYQWFNVVVFCCCFLLFLVFIGSSQCTNYYHRDTHS